MVFFGNLRITEKKNGAPICIDAPLQILRVVYAFFATSFQFTTFQKAFK